MYIYIRSCQNCTIFVFSCFVGNGHQKGGIFLAMPKVLVSFIKNIDVWNGSYDELDLNVTKKDGRWVL